MTDYVDVDAAVEEAKEAAIDQQIDFEELELQREVDEYAAEVRAEVQPDEGTEDLERGAVERLVRRYARLDQQAAEAVALADEEIAGLTERIEAIRARKESLLKPILRRRAWLDQYLPFVEAWLRKETEGKKSRSVNFLHGKVGLRKSTHLDVTDEAAVLRWCHFNLPDAVKETVSKTPLTAHIKETGEVPPGTSYVTEDRFYLETNNV